MERYINKQTWEFEVSYVATAEDEHSARDCSMEPENVIGITELNTDRPWDTESITGQPHPEINPHIMTVIDRIAGMLDAAQNPMTPEAIYNEALRRISKAENPYAAALEMIDQAHSHLQNEYVGKNYRDVIAFNIIREIVSIFNHYITANLE